ncbi:MAG: helix-turn-helix domain-containing protein [Nitrospirae bacterium]|nr:helix-turn-helix domain-containing protein [Nitrospirota bacterium]
MDQKELCCDVHELKELVRRVINLSGQNSYPRWMDVKAACAYTSMSKNTLMEYIKKDGCIYAKRLGGKWYIDRESIDSFMLQDPVKIHLSTLRFVR